MALADCFGPWRFGGLRRIVSCENVARMKRSGIVAQFEIGCRRVITSMRLASWPCAFAGVLALASPEPELGHRLQSRPLNGAVLLAQTLAGRETLNDCDAAITRQTAVTFADGSTGSVSATSMASYHGAVVAVGTPSYVWPRGSSRLNATGLVIDSIIGVELDANGSMFAIPNPTPGRHVLFPRVASGGHGDWDMIFVTTAGGPALNEETADSADIWYGNFAEKSWHGVARIGRVKSAMLGVAQASDLISSLGTLSFAFPITTPHPLSRTNTAKYGLVMAHRVEGIWRFDTLLTWRAPSSVQLTSDAVDSTIVAVFSQMYFEGQRIRPVSLFSAAYDSGWRTPRLLFTDSGAAPRQVIAPVARAGADGGVVSWSVDERAAQRGIEFEHLSGGAAHASPVRVGASSSVGGFALVRLDAERVLWLYRDPVVRNALRISGLVAGRGLADLGRVSVPLDNLTTPAVAISDSVVVVLSGKTGATDNETPASSYFDFLRIRCAARR